MKKHNTSLLVLWIAASLVTACETKGPAPGQELSTEPVEVTMAEREGAAPGADVTGVPAEKYKRDYQTAPHDPHGPAAHLNAPTSHVSGAVKDVDVGGLTFKAPEGWLYQHPMSSMRRAEFGVVGKGGTAGLVVYFFGNQGAGSAQANIDRWVGQFKNGDGSELASAKPIERKVAGLTVTQVEVAGTYLGGMGAGTPEGGKPGQRMIATIVATPTGPFYFKFLGDDGVVSANRDALEGLLASMKAAKQ